MIFLSIAAAFLGLMLFLYKSDQNSHKHKWWTEGVQTIKVFNPDNFQPNARPIAHKTHVSMSCEGCGEKKIEVLDGAWTSEIDKLT